MTLSAQAEESNGRLGDLGLDLDSLDVNLGTILDHGMHDDNDNDQDDGQHAQGLEIDFQFCHDGFDNDGDNMADRDDPDCMSFYICLDIDIPFLDISGNCPDTGGNNGTSTGTTTPGGNGTSTGTSTPGGNGTSTATSTPGGNGTSTATSTPGGNGTSTATSTPGGNGTSTSTSTPGNGTSTGTSTSTSTPDNNNNSGSGGGGGGGTGALTAVSGFSTFSGFGGFPNVPSVLGASTDGMGGSEDVCSAMITEYIGRNRGNSASEVRKLQVVLNQLLGTNVPLTGVFDDQTENAVRALQVREGEIILRPWVQAGRMTAPVSTGYVYKTTRWYLNNQLCPTSKIELPLVP